MTWLLLALLAAASTALRDVAAKQATRGGGDPIAVSTVIAAVPALTLGGVVLLRGPAAPGEGFLVALLVSGGINTVATPLLVWALRRSDLSLVAPLRSFTPMFMLVTATLILGERPSPLGAVGVAAIVAGAYLLNVSDRKAGLLAPIRALLADPGARAMFLVAFLYSISASYDKVGTQASSPLAWAAALHAVVAVALAPLAVWRAHRRRRRAAEAAPGARAGVRAPPGRDPSDTPAVPPLAGVRLGPVGASVLAGAVLAVGAAAQMTALTLTLAAYVIAVKRISTLFGVVLGHSLFDEAGVRERLLGAAVMLTGFIVLTLG